MKALNHTPGDSPVSVSKADRGRETEQKQNPDKRGIRFFPNMASYKAEGYQPIISQYLAYLAVSLI